MVSYCERCGGRLEGPSDFCLCIQVDNFFNQNRYLMNSQINYKRSDLIGRLKRGFTATALAAAIFACGPRDGAPGAKGDPGAAGRDGQDAVACTTTSEAGGVRITCPDGSTQLVENGHNGVDGTQVYMVQVCPSRGATIYPTSFPEFAYCIDNKLFATYWDGSHAFTAYIPPGNYSSTSPQGCTFQVGSGCQVTQL